jgi:integrase
VPKKRSNERDGIFQRPGRKGFYISYIDHAGKRRKQKVEAYTEVQAKAILAARKVEVAQIRSGLKPPPTPPEPEKPKPTTDELIIAYLQALKLPTKKRRRACSETTTARITGMLALLRPLLPERVDQITTAVLESVAATRADRAAATRSKEIIVLKGLARLAHKRGWLEADPGESLIPPEVKATKLRWLTVEEIARMLAESPDWLRPILAFAVFTGFRRAEILGLKWSDVDLTVPSVWLSHTKNGDAVSVRLNESALSVLRELPQGTGDARVFGDVSGPAVTVAARRLFARLGMTDASLHTLRHTYASHLVQDGADLYHVQRLLRHKGAAMTQRYSHLSPDHLAKETSRLDRVFAKAKPGPRLVPTASPAVSAATGTDGK